MSKPPVAFLGLGIMGSGMARRLLGAGFPLRVFNRNRAKASAFAAEGAQVCASPHEAAHPAAVVISMVADDVASRAMWLGDQGALSAMSPSSVLIECSTLTVAWVKELAALARQRGCELIDAPVTGSKVHAASGELNFLVGGSAAALEKVRPVLAAMSKGAVHLGPSGSGALIKLINNFLCGVQAASFAEGLALAERGGLDRAKATEVLLGGAPGSGVLKTISTRAAAGDFTPNFLLRLMAKDLVYSLKEGDANAVELKSVHAALHQFESAIKAGLGEQDFSAILKLHGPSR